MQLSWWEMVEGLLESLYALLMIDIEITSGEDDDESKTLGPLPFLLISLTIHGNQLPSHRSEERRVGKECW